MQTVDGRTLQLSDFGPSGPREFWNLLLLVDRIQARKKREREQMTADGRRNEHIVVRRPERQQVIERGDGRKPPKQAEWERIRDRRK